MGYYLFLSGITVAIALMAWAVWLKSKHIGYLVGIGILYYWSLTGAWFIVFDLRGGDSRLTYWYLYDKLVVVGLDKYYIETLFLYGLFILCVLVGILGVSAWGKPVNGFVAGAVTISHYRVLLIASVATFLSFVIFWAQIGEALLQGVSAYAITRSQPVALSTVAEELSRITLMSGGIGFAVLFSGDRGRFLVGRQRGRLITVGYLLILGGAYSLSAILGNRNALLFGVLTSVLFYIGNSRGARFGYIFALGLFATVVISVIETVRTVPLAELSTVLTWDTVWHAFLVPFQSIEMFSAHFSMYAVLSSNVPFTLGSSLWSLGASVVPRLIWPERPPDVYEYYASMVGAETGQGFTIHHATGWYLNFGIPGVVLGGMLLGVVWARCVNLLYLRRESVGTLSRVLAAIAPWTIVGNMPGFVRAGPEAYKGLVLECLVIPAIVVGVASVGIKNRRVSGRKPE